MTAAASSRRVEVPRWISWAVLGLLLAAVLGLALGFDRAGRPSLVGDEATYAMQAASLAWDLDLAYEREDYDRFVRHWGGPPDGLILQSRDGGRRITYGKPFLYALAAAPFVRAAPVRGALIANALLLAAAALLAARTLARQIGGAAPAWVAAWLFASVAFAYAFWVHADLFLLAATACGFALVYAGDRPPRSGPLPEIYEGEWTEGGRRFLLRWVAAGALLAVPGAFRPFYLALLLPAALAVPWERRRGGVAALAAGALGLLLVTALVQWGAGGSWTGYGGERQGFYPRTGYPDVDFPRSAWSESARRWGNTSWTQEGAIDVHADARLWGWNALYFLAGRNVGVLPYYLPLLLGFAAFRGERGRWALPWAVLLAAAGFLLVRPFNFYGGGGAIGNRYFLPLYPALWFLAARPARASWAVLAAALAAPFVWPLWLQPTAFPLGDDGRYRHVTEVARRWLPYETTQSHVPGGQDAAHDGLWVKLLDGDVWRQGDSADLRLFGDRQGEILVGSPRPLPAVLLELGAEAPSQVEIEGGRRGSLLLRPDGSIAVQVLLDEPRAVHPMWWSWDDWYLYELKLRLPGAPPVPIRLRVEPERQLVIEKSGG